jgi:hypothetical protein
MLIEIKGKAKHLKKKDIRKAVETFAGYLLSDKLSSRIELKIILSKKHLSKGIDGYCDWMDNSKSPRMFEIVVRPSLKSEDLLQLLAHEMVHLKQFAKNELFDYSCGSKSRFNGKVYTRDKIDYWFLPWEIEAYGRERGLYVKYIESLENDK